MGSTEKKLNNIPTSPTNNLKGYYSIKKKLKDSNIRLCKENSHSIQEFHVTYLFIECSNSEIHRK